MRKKKWQRMRQSIAVLVLFILMISAVSVSAAETGGSDTLENSSPNTTAGPVSDGGAEIVSVFRVSELETAAAETTCISQDEETAMEQLAGLIPDLNFRREVYRSLKTAGQLGTYGDEAHPEYDVLTGDELYKAVLQNFTGVIYGSGYVKEMGYKYEFRYKLPDESEWETYTYQNSFDSSEQAYEQMMAMITFYKTMLGYAVDEENARVFSFIDVTDEKKPEEDLITDITGIVWLRHAEKIDVSDNRITSLMPMDINALDQEIIEKEDLDGGKKWFGELFRNVHFDFSGNPINEFPAFMPGRIVLDVSFAQGDTQYERNPLLVVKNPDGKTWPRDFEIEMPVITLDGKALNYTEATVNGSGIDSFGENVSFEYTADAPHDSGSIILKNVEHTGRGEFNASVQMAGGDDLEENQIKWYTAAENNPSAGGGENINTSASTMSVRFTQALRVLYDVHPAEAVSKVSVSFEKTELNSPGTAVADAEYTLFKMETDSGGSLVYDETDTVTVRDSGDAYNQDGEKIAVPLSDGTYTTDENGNFTITEMELSPGWYCLIETKAPEGYELNTTPLLFEAGSAEVRISGGTALTNIKFEKLSEGSGSYQLYYQYNGEDFEIYNNDSERFYQTDADGTFSINGLPDGAYQLKKVKESGSTEDEIIEFEINGNDTEIAIDGKARISLEKSVYTDSEAPVEIVLEPSRDDMNLQSVTVFWHDSGGTEQSSEFSTADEAENFINHPSNEVYGPLRVQPVYLQTGTLRAEDPKKTGFSFTKTDGEPSDDRYQGLAGAEFTLYQADENWHWSEKNVYRTAPADEESGIVDFGNLDSGRYIMKETKTPDGYASLPGYWKITADAKAPADADKLIFRYVREDGIETEVSQSEMIPADIYGSRYYIPNHPVDKLPAMGGNGTQKFVVLGLLLIGTASVLFGCAMRNQKRGIKLSHKAKRRKS